MCSHYDDEELYEYTDEECDGGCECDCHSHHHDHSHDGHYEDGEDDEYDDDPDADYNNGEDEVYDEEALAHQARWDGEDDKYYYNVPAGGGDAGLFQKAFAQMTPEQQRQLVGMAQTAQPQVNIHDT